MLHDLNFHCHWLALMISVFVLHIVHPSVLFFLPSAAVLLWTVWLPSVTGPWVMMHRLNRNLNVLAALVVKRYNVHTYSTIKSRNSRSCNMYMIWAFLPFTNLICRLSKSQNTVFLWAFLPFTDLIRRLSKSQNTVFCGRFQLFLSRLFPLSEKSGLHFYIVAQTFSSGSFKLVSGLMWWSLGL